MSEFDDLIIDDDTGRILDKLANSAEEPRILAEIAGIEGPAYVESLETTGLIKDPDALKFLVPPKSR